MVSCLGTFRAHLPASLSERLFTRDASLVLPEKVPSPLRAAGTYWIKSALDIVSTAALHHLFWPHVGVGSKPAANFRDRHGRTCFNTGRQGTQPNVGDGAASR